MKGTPVMWLKLRLPHLSLGWDLLTDAIAPVTHLCHHVGVRASCTTAHQASFQAEALLAERCF